jgi:hypothetical protein
MTSQPGFVTCTSVTLALLIAADLAFIGLESVPPAVLVIMPGAAVAVAWLSLAVSGRWRPEAGWIDR